MSSCLYCLSHKQHQSRTTSQAFAGHIQPTDLEECTKLEFCQFLKLHLFCWGLQHLVTAALECLINLLTYLLTYTSILMEKSVKRCRWIEEAVWTHTNKWTLWCRQTRITEHRLSGLQWHCNAGCGQPLAEWMTDRCPRTSLEHRGHCWWLHELWWTASQYEPYSLSSSAPSTHNYSQATIQCIIYDSFADLCCWSFYSDVVCYTKLVSVSF